MGIINITTASQANVVDLHNLEFWTDTTSLYPQSEEQEEGGGEDLSFQRFHLVKGNVMARDTHHTVGRGGGEGGGLASGETMLQQGSKFF